MTEKRLNIDNVGEFRPFLKSELKSKQTMLVFIEYPENCFFLLFLHNVSVIIKYFIRILTLCSKLCLIQYATNRWSIATLV